MKKIAVFASGFGSNFQAIIEAVKQQTLNAEIALLVSDNPSSKAVERANAAGIDAFTFCAKEYAGKAAYEQAVLAELRKRQVEYIVLAGYMRIIGPTLLEAYPMHIITDAFHYGVKVFGITIHFVDEGVDTGKIINQFAFHAEPGDTLETVETKIHQLEHKYFPMVINDVLVNG